MLFNNMSLSSFSMLSGNNSLFVCLFVWVTEPSLTKLTLESNFLFSQIMKLKHGKAVSGAWQPDPDVYVEWNHILRRGREGIRNLLVSFSRPGFYLHSLFTSYLR